MIVRKDCMTFIIMGEEVDLFCDETSYGRNTVAKIGNYYHYLGDENSSIATAIFAWQELYERELTEDELRQIMIDNNLISQGI